MRLWDSHQKNLNTFNSCSSILKIHGWNMETFPYLSFYWRVTGQLWGTNRTELVGDGGRRTMQSDGYALVEDLAHLCHVDPPQILEVTQMPGKQRFQNLGYNMY